MGINKVLSIPVTLKALLVKTIHCEELAELVMNDPTLKTNSVDIVARNLQD